MASDETTASAPDKELRDDIADLIHDEAGKSYDNWPSANNCCDRILPLIHREKQKAVREALAKLSQWECRSGGWAYQVGSIGGGCGYTSKNQAINKLCELLFPPAK